MFQFESFVTISLTNLGPKTYKLSALTIPVILATLLTGCCPNENPFERSLKRFLLTNLGEVEDKRCQLFELQGRVLTSPGGSLRFVKKRFRPSEKGFWQQPANY